MVVLMSEVWNGGKFMRKLKIHNYVLIVFLMLSLTINTRLTAMAAAVLPDAGTYTYDENNSLYAATNFHIFALESATLGAHTFGNVATSTLYGDNNFGMPNYSDDISYLRKIDKINNSSTASTLVVGKDVLVELVDNGNKIALNGYQMSNISKDKFRMDNSGKYIDLEKEFDKLTELSEYIGKLQKTNGYRFDFNDMNNRKIICVRNEINVILLDYNYLTKDTDIKIQELYPSEGGTVIINVDLNGVPNANITSKINLTFNGVQLNNTHRTDFSESHILWNFYDSSKVDYCYRGEITINQNWLGTILAPGATVRN
ncbi:MAG: hypothetical protein K0S61_3419 [Anaerocolumna sp.]|nr:hypothetical protein [Anaerocolumna sp.]